MIGNINSLNDAIYSTRKHLTHLYSLMEDGPRHSNFTKLNDEVEYYERYLDQLETELNDYVDIQIDLHLANQLLQEYLMHDGI